MPEPIDDERPRNAPRLPRRRILGAAGLGVGAAAAGGAGIAIVRDTTAPGTAAAVTSRTPGYDGQTDTSHRFSRLFPDEAPFAQHGPELTEALIELGRSGGIMDAMDPDGATPEDLLHDPGPGNPDNPTIPAGLTYAGQFLDHDITRDAGSRLGSPQPLHRTVNLRTAAFDLDSVYGDGPLGEPEVYDPDDPIRFRPEDGGRYEDLPRNVYQRALVPDRRNDENLMINGLHCAFLFFHNAVLDRVIASGLDDMVAFDEARRLVRWHYQWLIVHEWLPAFVGPAMVNDVLANGRRVYTRDAAQIPVEFQVGVFRFGHSMVRPSYRANNTGDDGAPFVAPIFDPLAFSGQDPPSMTGGFRSTRRYIDWDNYFDFGTVAPMASKLINPQITSQLLELPVNTFPPDRNDDDGPKSLASRNLLRHVTFGIPSGQRIAERLGEPGLTAADLDELAGFGAGLQASTPLFYYVLREAELAAGGQHLGPVGGRLLTEVFIGLLELDPASYLTAEPNWTPTMPIADPAVGFRTTDLLTAAGVDPAGRAAWDPDRLAPGPSQWRA